jgi:hypothetical protein
VSTKDLTAALVGSSLTVTTGGITRTATLAAAVLGRRRAGRRRAGRRRAGLRGAGLVGRQVAQLGEVAVVYGVRGGEDERVTGVTVGLAVWNPGAALRSFGSSRK